MCVTNPARTLLDIASQVDEETLERSLDMLWRRGSVHPERLAEFLDARWCRTRPGSDTLRSLVSIRAGRAPDSDLESLYLRLLRRARLPLPERQFVVSTPSGRRRIDCAYPSQMVAIELDGFEPHVASRRRFEDDRVRQNEIEALGYTFRRFTWRQVTREPTSVIVTTAEAIGLRPDRWVSAR